MEIGQLQLLLWMHKSLKSHLVLLPASYTVKLRRPTPTDVVLKVTSQIKELTDDRVEVELLLEANGKVCATGSGLFVAVKEGHPAYHRWS